MSGWSEGYVADIPYALGFYRETAPSHIAFAAACVGRKFAADRGTKRVLELGFGMGLGFIITAAANPAIQFEGVDFNPLHVAHARGLMEAADLGNVTLREASFQEVAREAREGQQDLDLIVLHGILTWVSSDAQEAIVEIARKRLKPGGFLYVSYNAMPGWAPLLPMQRLMRENAKRSAARSDVQTNSGIELLKALIGEGAGYFRANPALEQRVEKMSAMDRSYLAHEYLNANWFIFHFADVAEMFGQAKLGFAGSATLIENVDALSLPERSRARVGTEQDPVFKETLRDVASNKQFRRDLFSRGALPLTPPEHAEYLASLRFVPTVARAKLSFKFQSPIGDLDGNPEIYGPLADLLAAKSASFGEILALPAFKQGGINAALQAVTLLVHSGQVMPVPAGPAPELKPAQRLNKVIVERVLKGRVYSFLAAPVCGSGLQVQHSDLLLLAASQGKAEDAKTTAQSVMRTMQRLGINWMKDGKPITDEAERLATITAEAEAFRSEKLPAWKRLGIL